MTRFIGTAWVVTAIVVGQACSSGAPDGIYKCSITSDCPAGWSCRPETASSPELRCFRPRGDLLATMDAPIASAGQPAAAATPDAGPPREPVDAEQPRARAEPDSSIPPPSAAGSGGMGGSAVAPPSVAGMTAPPAIASCAVDNGGCHPAARCVEGAGALSCECGSMRLGDGVGAEGCREKLIQLGGGYNFVCALSEAGRVYCWGKNQLHQLGDGSAVDRRAAAPVPGLQDVIALNRGSSQGACAIRKDRTLVCWGANTLGELGDGTTSERALPVVVPGASGVGDVYRGIAATCLRLEDSTVSCWGAPWVIGDYASDLWTVSPAPISGLRNVVELAIGRQHACAVQQGGRMSCWGNDHFGQIGAVTPPVSDSGCNNGTAPCERAAVSPTLVTLADQIEHVTADEKSTCVTRTDKTLRCWGFVAPDRDMAIDLGRDFELISMPSNEGIYGLHDDGSIRMIVNPRDNGVTIHDLAALPKPAVDMVRNTPDICELTADSIVHCFSANEFSAGATVIDSAL
jgi:hypothetical protein